MRCIHCPTLEGVRCAGLLVRRFCELIDPSCAQYDSRYKDVIVRESHRPGEDTSAQLTSHHQPGFGKPIIEGGDTTVISFDCCGGGVPPGILDEL
jgi:hypothetical protein